ncbi:hypothetical protein ID854_21500, partial [Xenorhabdus sp. M]|nr:hypothetical protein [Xenorhabdus sp. M]
MNPLFLPAPDDAGSVLHEALFIAQVTGLRQHPTASQLLLTDTLTIGEAATITEIVQRLKVIHLLGDWPALETLSGQCERAFFPLTVMIVDAQDRKVLGGRFDDE